MENDFRSILTFDPVNVVALAWTLSSKSEGVNYEEFVNNYLNKLTSNYESDENARAFFKNILPSLYAVSAKVSIQRTRTADRFKKLDELKENKLKQLEKISDLGSSVKGIFSRIIGIIGGAGIGAIAGNLDTGKITAEALASILLGIALGYGVIEFIFWIYKKIESDRIIKDNWNQKEKIWDKEFTSETHLASIYLYNEVLSFIEKNSRNHKKTRDISRDFQKMTQMFMERPLFEEGTVSTLTEFFGLSIRIEDKLREFINSYFKKEFKEFRERHGKNEFELEAYNSGLRSLSTFLSETKISRVEDRYIIDGSIFEKIKEIREIRKNIIWHANYEALKENVNKAKEVFKDVDESIKYFKDKYRSNSPF